MRFDPRQHQRLGGQPFQLLGNGSAEGGVPVASPRPAVPGSRRTVPEPIGTSPQMARSTVDLPEPDSPTMPKLSPGSTRNDVASTATDRRGAYAVIGAGPHGLSALKALLQHGIDGSANLLADRGRDKDALPLSRESLALRRKFTKGDAVPLARALVKGGLPVLEITLRTATAMAALEAIAKAGKNDCQTATHSCAGTSTADADAASWIYLPAGTCEKLADGSLEPKA